MDGANLRCFYNSIVAGLSHCGHVCAASRYAKTRAPADGLAAARAKKAGKKKKQKETAANKLKKINKKAKKGKGCGPSRKR